MNTGYRVLVVDPNKIVRDWVKGALTPGIEVEELETASAVDASTLEAQPDLILIDDEISPSEIERIVKLSTRQRAEKRTSVVLFSTLSPERLEQKVATLGAQGFLRKSGDAESFRSRVLTFMSAAEPALTRAPAENTPRRLSGVIGTSPKPAAPIGARTVLIAGQDPWSRVVINWLTTRFSLFSTTNAEDTCQAIDMRKPSLVVLGQDLADASAAKLCRRIRNNDRLRNISLLYIGPPGDTDAAKKADEAGANACLLRPLDENLFFATVNSLGHVAVRRDSRLLVRLEVELTSGSSFHVGFTSNLSASGMLVESDYQAAIGDVAGARFFLPGRSHEIAVQFKVVRIQTRNNGKVSFGAQFVSLPPASLAAIEEFVDSRRQAFM